MSTSSPSVIRPYPYREHRHGLNHFLSDIDRTRLSSRERHFNRLYCRSPSIQRFHRIQQLRRRNETHRQFIAADNAALDLLATQPRPRNSEEERSTEATGTNDTATNADDSVLIVNEVKFIWHYIIWHSVRIPLCWTMESLVTSLKKNFVDKLLFLSIQTSSWKHSTIQWIKPYSHFTLDPFNFGLKISRRTKKMFVCSSSVVNEKGMCFLFWCLHMIRASLRRLSTQ